MSVTILSTKLFIPPTRPVWVLRPRLLHKLTAGWQTGCKVGLISAPAGFGKTTLAAGWIHSMTSNASSPGICWLSLDSGDNDLVVFVSYLLAALRSHLPKIGEGTAQLLNQTILPPVESLLLPLVNDLSQVSNKLLLVLDDYHTIQQPVIHEAMTFLIEHMPESMCVLITTRQDPLLPLARWRVRGQLTEIRLRELRFTEEEAAEFLNRSMGFNLLAEDIAALEERTEGWIAGLQLAAISMMQSGSESEPVQVTGYVQSFTGNDRFVMEYLVDEVLDRQPESVQQFLLTTSVLDRFNEGLCEAVIDSQEFSKAPASGNFQTAASILAYLEQTNLFLIPLDNRREWFRYHHLFSDLLQNRLKSTQGKNQITEIKRRASLWFDDDESPDEAIRYAQSAADWDLSIRFIQKYSRDLFQKGELATILRWLGALPDSVVRGNPELCRNYGYVLTIAGKLDVGEYYLKFAEENFPGDSIHLGRTLAFASYNACFKGEFQKEIDLAKRALALIPHDDTWTRGIAAVSLGLGLCHIGDPQGCENAMREAFMAGQLANTVRTCVHALTYLGRMSVLRLDFQQAESYFRQAIQYKVNGQTFTGIDIPILDLVQLKYEQNDLEQAEELVMQGIETNQRSGSIEMRAYAYRQMARLKQLKGLRDEAYDYLKKALDLSKVYTLSPLTLSLNAVSEVDMSLADGDLHTAEQAAWRVTNSLGLYSFNFYPEMARARFWLAQGNYSEANKLLEPVLKRVLQPGWEYPRLQVRVLQALGEVNRRKAYEFLIEALALAEPARAVRCFIDLGVPMYRLLREIHGQSTSQVSGFLSYLLNTFKNEVPQPPGPEKAFRLPQDDSEVQQANDQLIEPLTDRELEVLSLLAAGLSNAEIAEKLFLSVNTMKAHTQNIYSKLDVHSRVQAVNKARDLKLIQ